MILIRSTHMCSSQKGLCFYENLTGGRAQVVTPAALNTDETLLAPLLLTSCCALIYGISADLWPGGWGPLSYNNGKLDINSNTLNLYAPQSINWNIC